MVETSTVTGNESTPAAPGQRRQVTVLFADMAGYTALAEKLGEEKTYLLMQRLHRELSEAVHSHDGTVQEMTGDGIMALFGAPVAIEDAPLKACHAALDIQARMSAIANEIEAEHGEAARFRVGIHSGPLVVGEVGDAQKSGVTALGDTVNLASRIETEAETGTVLMSEATHALVEGYVESVYIGERTLKGKAEPQKLWRLDAVLEGVTRFDIARRRGLAPLVARKPELQRLDGYWRQVAAGAQQAVAILGEAGIGKSRLLHEFRSRVDDGRAVFLECHCAHGLQGIPFAPLIEIVRAAFRIPDDADTDEVARRLKQGLEILGIAAEISLPYLLNLLGHGGTDTDLDNIAGETLGIRTRDAVLAMLRERCRISPTMIVVDDLHWADKATEGLLKRIVEDAAEMPLMILATARTGYSLPWADGQGANELRLAPLSESGTAALAEGCLGSADLPPALHRLVVEKSEGNPLFAEELISYLRSSGAIRTDGGTVAFDGGEDAVALPAAIENLLMDRFDRLDREARTALETAAVIGTRFSKELLGLASGLGEAAAAHLDDLVAQEMIELDRGGGYRFRHAMARSAIHDSLLTQQRQQLHERIAEAIESLNPGRPDETIDILAHHWSRTARADKAVEYLALAGENNLRIYSLDEAAGNFRQALDLIEAHPGCAEDTVLVDLLLNIARVLYYQSEFYAIIDLVEPYLPRVEALGDDKRLSRFLFESGYAHVFASQVKEGRVLLARSRALGEAAGDELAIAYADLGLMWDRLFWGQPGDARLAAQREAGSRLVDVGRREGDIWLASKASLALALDLVAWGRPGESRAEVMRLMAMSRETNDPRPRTMGLWALAAIDVFAGDYAEAIGNAEEALRVTLSPIDSMAAQSYKAIAMILSGQADEGLALAAGPLLRSTEEKGLTMTLELGKMAFGIGRLMQGEMAQGVREIEAATAEYVGLGQTAAQAFGNMMLGETYLQLVISEEKPPLSVMLRNLPFLLATLPFAKRKSRRRIQDALDEFRRLESPFSIARCLYFLAILDKVEKRPAAARERLQEAREIADAVEASNLVADIDTAMAALPAA